MHIARVLLLAPAILIAVGCSSAGESVNSNGQAVHASGFRPGRGFMPTVDQAKALAERPNALSTGTLQYYGGKVISKARVVNIYWGNAGSYRSQLDTFTQTLVASSYVGGLSEYDTSTQTISAGTFVKSVVDTHATVGGTVNDTQIRAELDALVTAGTIPAPDGNTLYLFFFPNGTNVTAADAGTSCIDFCGYHETYVSGSREYYYGALPDPATCGSSCDNQNGNYFADLTSVTTHEIAEAITDAEVGLAIQNANDGGTYPTFPNAWTSASGEIGDLCAWQNATFSGYNVQLEWSNAANGCVVPGAGQSDGGTDGGGPTNLVTNGGFENGSNGWTFHEKRGLAVESQIVHSGSNALQIGSSTPYTGYAIVTQSVALPSTGTSTLTFWGYYTCGAGASAPKEYQQLRILDANGTVLKTVFRQCKNDRTWDETTVDLSTYDGRTITLQFAGKDVATSAADPWYLDDVSVTNK